MLEERIRQQLHVLRDTERGRRKFDTKAMKDFLTEQELYLNHMNKQLILDELVKKGEVDDSHLFSEFNKTNKKRRLDGQ